MKKSIVNQTKIEQLKTIKRLSTIIVDCLTNNLSLAESKNQEARITSLLLQELLLVNHDD